MKAWLWNSSAAMPGLLSERTADLGVTGAPDRLGHRHPPRPVGLLGDGLLAPGPPWAILSAVGAATAHRRVQVRPG